jgi:hypothetical protein
MNAGLITNWTEHDRSLQEVLVSASRTLRVFDEDLGRLKLERRDSAEILRSFLGASRDNSLVIVLRNAEPVRRESPRLMRLLTMYPNSMTILERHPHLAPLNDALLIADSRHALIRFHKDNVRSKCIIDDSKSCLPYVQRFDEILREGGDPVSTTILGL